MPNWPFWYPEGCPPASATLATGMFYRLVKNDPPLDVDFESFLEKEVTRKPNRESTVQDVSDASVSILQEHSDAVSTQEFIPGMRTRKIALGSIDNSGTMQPNPMPRQPSHFDWWRPFNDVAWRSFSVVIS